MLRALIFTKLHTLISMKKKRQNNVKASSQCQLNICYLVNYSNLRLIKSLRKRQERNRKRYRLIKCQVKIKLPPTQINQKNQLPLWRDSLKTGQLFPDKNLTIITIIVNTKMLNNEFLTYKSLNETRKCSRVHQSITILSSEKEVTNNSNLNH